MVVMDVMFFDGGFCLVKLRKVFEKCQLFCKSGKSISFLEDYGSDNDDENESLGVEVENEREKLFVCLNEGCIKMY